MATELSQEDVFANDLDPLDAIRELRKAEGVPEDDLPPASEKSEVAPEPTSEEDDAEELTAFDEEEETEDEPVTTEASEEDASEEQDEEEEDSAEQEEKPAEKPEEPTKYNFRANGKDYEFTQEEVLSQFETVFGQAVDYTQKMQKMAPYRKMISALEEENITADALNLAIDALKGDKGAIVNLLKAHEIDAYDLTGDDAGQGYVPNVYGKEETQMSIDEVADRISGDPEYKITVDVVDRQWDNDSRKAFASNPSMIEGLHADIKSGVYDQVAPVAMKMKVLDGNTKSDIEYYMLAGEQLQKQQQTSNTSEKTVQDLNKSTQDAEANFDKASSEAGKKRAATSTRARADRKGVIDYLDDDDEAFDAWYKKLQDSN